MDENRRASEEMEMIEPSPDFAQRVMSAVRREPRAPEPLQFPWRRATLGGAIGVVAALASFAAPGVSDAVRGALAVIDTASRAVSQLAFAAVAAVLFLTLVLVQSTLWLAGRRT
jgi:hypothetical protein